MNWKVDFPIRTLLAGPQLFVGDWFCAGEVRQWSREHARYHQIELQREGTHVRRSGRWRSVIDATMVAFDQADDEYAISSPTPHAQRTTILLVHHELAEELGLALSACVRPVSTAAALLHHVVLSAPDSVAREEGALALIHRLVGDARATPERAGSPSPAWRRLTDEARHVIATRYHERLTLQAIAAACGSSPFHLSRVFRSVTGETVHRSLTRLRLRTALLDHKRSTGRLGEIALRVGFSSHSHFTSAFRSEFGAPPSRWMGEAALLHAARPR